VIIISSHGPHHRARKAFTRIAGFFANLRKTAEQLTPLECWSILGEALKKFLRARLLIPARYLPPAVEPPATVEADSDVRFKAVNFRI
jgi:hypothetical protein